MVKFCSVALLALLLSYLAMKTLQKVGLDVKDFKQRTKPVFLSIAAVFNLAFVYAVALVMKTVNLAPFSSLMFGLDSVGWAMGLGSVGVTLFVAFLFVWILKQTYDLKMQMDVPYFKNAKDTFEIVLGFLVLFLAAFQEEVMFRGYFVLVLMSYGLRWAAILSSLIFTAWHFLTNKVTFFQIVDWLVGGFMLFLVYVTSGSIWVATFVYLVGILQMSLC